MFKVSVHGVGCTPDSGPVGLGHLRRLTSDLDTASRMAAETLLAAIGGGGDHAVMTAVVNPMFCLDLGSELQRGSSPCIRILAFTGKISIPKSNMACTVLLLNIT